jgi:hypothetical protein
LTAPATPYPLQWPAGRQRRAARKDGRFRKYHEEITVARALARLQAELDLIGARYPVVSSNLETRLDGLPRSGQAEPRDPGVAVYFQLGGKPHCLPCDTYTKVAQNIAAVAAHIEATRAIERHGVASVAEMFAGFLAIEHRNWRGVLGFLGATAVNRENVERRFRELARAAHPDTGGNHNRMADLNWARDEALRELAGD